MGLFFNSVFLCSLVFLHQSTAWDSLVVIPKTEDDSCPDGLEIPCGTVIDKNETVLRYERINATRPTYPVPSKDCEWKIRAPPGCSLLIETSCFHHYHDNYTKEHFVCFRFTSDLGGIVSASDCGNGYVKKMNGTPHEIGFSVFYKDEFMVKEDLGFTTKFTFIGEPDKVTTEEPTTVPATSNPIETTSKAFSIRIASIALAFCVVLTYMHI